MKRSGILIGLLIFSTVLSACVTAEQLCNRAVGLIVQKVTLGNGQKIEDYVSERLGPTSLEVVYEARGDMDFCVVQFMQDDASNPVLALDVNMESGHVSAGNQGGEELMQLLMDAFIKLPE